VSLVLILSLYLAIVGIIIERSVESIDRVTVSIKDEGTIRYSNSVLDSLSYVTYLLVMYLSI
jgi:hypothetical protein